MALKSNDFGQLFHVVRTIPLFQLFVRLEEAIVSFVYIFLTALRSIHFCSCQCCSCFDRILSSRLVLLRPSCFCYLSAIEVIRYYWINVRFSNRYQQHPADSLFQSLYCSVSNFDGVLLLQNAMCVFGKRIHATAVWGEAPLVFALTSPSGRVFSISKALIYKPLN